MSQSKIHRQDAVKEQRAWPAELERWALQLEQQRSDLIAMLTHDARNRLFVILNYAEILRERAQVRGMRDDQVVLESLKSNCVALHSLITSCLSLLQLQSGHVGLDRAPVDLNSVLERVMQQFAPEAQRRQINLKFALAPTLLPVDGDPLALERVFANLIHNALKFTPMLGRVVIASRQRADEVVVSVTDTGPGIAPEHAALLTELDCRDNNGATPHGLGLRIVRALVSAHDGWVEVSSVPRTGTCVSVFLRTIPAATDRGTTQQPTLQ
jgi:signal transduction histidine kinase